MTYVGRRGKSGDSDFIRRCLQIMRGWGDKDREVVVLKRPPVEFIDWWDEATSRWRHAQDLVDAQQ